MGQKKLDVARQNNETGNMVPQPVIASYDEEFDLYGVLGTLAGHSKRLGAVLGLILVIIAALYGYYRTQKSASSFIRYNLSVALHFEGLNNKTYPDGTAFNPNDVVSPDILEKVFNKYNINKVALNNFISAFSAQYETVDSVKKGEVDPKTNKPAADVIAPGINPALVKIYMNMHSRSLPETSLSGEEIKAIMTDIPDLWATKFKKRYLNKTFQNPLLLVEFNRFNEMEYGEIYRSMKDNLDKLVADIKREEGKRAINSYRSRSLNLSLAEAYFMVSTQLSYELDNWVTMANSYGIFKDIRKREGFLKNQQSNLKIRQEILAKKNIAVEHAINSLRNPQGQSFTTEAMIQRENSSAQMKNPSIFRGQTGNDPNQFQFNDTNLLERVFKSGEESKLSAYIQELTTKMLDGVNELSYLDMEIAQVNKELALIERHKSGNRENDKTLQSEVELELNRIIELYKKWVDACVTIAEESVKADLADTGGVLSIASPLTREEINGEEVSRLFKQLVVVPAAVLLLAFFGYCSYLVLQAGCQSYRKNHA